jgi:hypothetical protein
MGQTLQRMAIYLVKVLKWEHVASANIKKLMVAVGGKLVEAFEIYVGQ